MFSPMDKLKIFSNVWFTIAELDRDYHDYAVRDKDRYRHHMKQ